MTEINANMVKELRDKTGAGMMDCKKALVEAGGDMEAAIDWLRKKGLSAAAKKAGRVAAEGLIAIAADAKKAAVVEINAETDFVARNDKFQEFCRNAAQTALSGSSTEALKQTTEEAITNLVATIGENMSVRRAASLSVSKGVIATYMHGALAPNLGKIGVLVGLESDADTDKLTALGKQIAMHIAAARPDALNVADVDSKALDRERNIFADQARASGKPEEIIGKMVEGRVRKYYEEVVLMEQVYVVDGKTKISDVIAAAGKTLGTPIKITGFVRYQLGEGIEKTQDDFAAEVAKMAQ
ncbi:MAG: translation elongation factor Ts [Alphaproteobacteria bacterium]|nr:translation elongation factor Ts [Alphaproteobacteria bacterium]MCL2505811.1 translation elongation factor Ts [Alphaproteobacteria bacterium]